MIKYYVDKWGKIFKASSEDLEKKHLVGAFREIHNKKGSKIMNKITLGQIRPGNIIKLGKKEYIVLGHGTDTTAIITKDFVNMMKFGENNNYQTSKIREYCNTTFYNELVEAVGAKNIIKHKVRLMADDGTNKGVICCDNVSILTTELYRRYRQYLPAYGNWWWTATPVSSTINNFTHRVCFVCPDGTLFWNNCNYCSGVRPFCILNSSILI